MASGTTPISEPEKSAEAEEETETAPGVAGALVSLANSKPFTALLGPAFGVYGKFLAENAEQQVERWRAKRADNLKRHSDRVLEVQGAPSESGPTPEQIHQTAEWSEGAQTIDPEKQPDLAALWQGLLGNIREGADNTAEMLSALQQLGPREAALLLDLDRQWSPPKDYNDACFAKLERLGILTAYRFSLRSMVEKLAVLYSVAGIGAIIVGFQIDNFGRPPFPNLTFGSLAVLIVMFILFVAWFPVLSRLGRYRLTELGMDLQMSGLRYKRIVPDGQ